MRIIRFPNDDKVTISLTKREEKIIGMAMNICDQAYKRLEKVDLDAALETSFYDAVVALEDIYANNEVTL